MSRQRPVPTRTLKQPLSLNVAERVPGANAVTTQETSDAAQLRASLERRAKIAKLAEKWGDRAMEEVLDRDSFQKAVSPLMPTCTDDSCRTCTQGSMPRRSTNDT